MPERQNSPVRENMSYTQLRERVERGEMLTYKDATNEQLELRRTELLDRVNKPRLEGGVWLRDIVMNTVYAGISIGTSLWFAATNILKSSNAVSNWLSETGLLRNAHGEPYVNNVAELHRNLTGVVQSWGRTARRLTHDGVAVSEVAKATQPYALLKTTHELLEKKGFQDSTGLVQKFLETHYDNQSEVTLEMVAELRKNMQKHPAYREDALMNRMLRFFHDSERYAGVGFSEGAAAEYIGIKMQEKTASLFDLHEHNSKIFNRRVAPVVLGVGAAGALAIGYGSWKAAREREAFVDSSELGHVERLLHERDKKQQAQEEVSVASVER